jgi:cell division protein FtsQ
MVRGGGSRRWRLVRAPQEAIPSSLRRLHHRADRRRRRLVVPLVAAATVLAIAGTVAWLVFSTSAAGVKQITVTGGHLVRAAQVREVAGVTLGTPLARIDLAAVRDRVRTLAAVRDATVRRQWPSTLVITVTERTPLAAVKTGHGYLVLDADGVVFQTLSSRPARLCLLRLSHPGRTDPSTRAAVTVVLALTPALRAVMAVLAVESPTRIRLELTDGRVVVWGDAEDSRAKAAVATSFLGRNAATIDVSAPEFVTVS